MLEKNKEQWFIYLLECLDGSLYTGVTNDLEKRMDIHKSGKGSKYVRAKGFSKLLANKNMENKVKAMKEEYYVKQLSHNEKLDWFRKDRIESKGL